MMDRGWEGGHGPRDWQSMEPEQREKREKVRSKYQNGDFETEETIGHEPNGTGNTLGST
jgi:hypothetical protein